MRVYHRETMRGVSTGGAAAVWTNPVPTAVVTTSVAGGAVVQAGLVAVYNATYNRLYFDTADALYTSAVLYQADWTITIAGTAYTTTDYYVHATPAAAGAATSAAGAAIVGLSDTTITLGHTPPTEANYSYTVVYAILTPGDGTAAVTATGSGATITVSGLQAARGYIFVAVAYNTDGVPSIVGVNSVAQAETYPTERPDLALLVKLFVNGEPQPRKVYYLDPTVVDANSAGATNFELKPNTRGRIHRVRLECDAPVRIRCRSIGGLFGVREGEVGGFKGSAGN